MNYSNLLVTETPHSLVLTIHRPNHRNSINARLLAEIKQVMDIAERDQKYRLIILQGEDNIFCTGMDFQEIVKNEGFLNSDGSIISQDYMELLKRFTTTSKIIVSLIDGQVLAGGVGFVAASDLVLSTSRSQFGLSEALWGLLPACVMPFLIRRIGFQKAYYMTLTTQTMTAEDAYGMNLVDELTDNLNDSLRLLILRLNRISEETVGNLKSYFRKMWIITELMEETAVAEINHLMKLPYVQTKIKNFIQYQQISGQNTIKEHLCDE